MSGQGRVYGARAGVVQVDAQRILDEHLTSSADGACSVCAVPGPCGRYEDALRAFAFLRRLPRRTPGATLPRGVALSPVAWFGSSVRVQ
jgi:hypothetical protein